MSQSVTIWWPVEFIERNYDDSSINWPEILSVMTCSMKISLSATSYSVVDCGKEKLARFYLEVTHWMRFFYNSDTKLQEIKWWDRNSLFPFWGALYGGGTLYSCCYWQLMDQTADWRDEMNMHIIIQLRCFFCIRNNYKRVRFTIEIPRCQFTCSRVCRHQLYRGTWGRFCWGIWRCFTIWN